MRTNFTLFPVNLWCYYFVISNSIFTHSTPGQLWGHCALKIIALYGQESQRPYALWRAHRNLTWHTYPIVSLPEVGLSWTYHTAFTSKVKSILRAPRGWKWGWEGIRVSVTLGSWHLSVMMTQAHFDPPSTPLQERSRFMPRVWTWGHSISLQQLLSVSTCQLHKFQFSGGNENGEDKTVVHVLHFFQFEK